MDGLLIRQAKHEDLEIILRLYVHLHSEDPPADNEAADAAWAAVLSSGLTTVFVAQVGDALAATCTLAVIPNLTRSARPFGIIENVVTDPGHRQRGLGRAVLDAAMRAAWDADCYKVMLVTGSRKPGTLAFYTGAGLEQGGKTYFEARRP